MTSAAGTNPDRLANTVIAGVTKAGTTSLFVSLSEHPDVAPAAVKETRYFLPARYGQPLAPISAYERFFPDADRRAVRLEATPSYFYGGAPLVRAMTDVLDCPRIVVSFRDPVRRFVSFFEFQKTRLRLPSAMTIGEYLAEAARRSDADFRSFADDVWFGFRGGCYADFLPAWTAAFGDRLKVVFFEDLVEQPAGVFGDLAVWLGIDPAPFAHAALSSENRTTGFRNCAFQRAALQINDRFERVFRRHPEVERRLRKLYYAVNGRAAGAVLPDDVRSELRERYREPNARLAAQLQAHGDTELPAWLTG